MSKEVIKKPFDVIKGAIQDTKFKKEIATALGNNNNADRFIRGVLTTITLNKNLHKCTPNSILKAILVSAQLGLEVDAKQHGYLIPFNDEATFMAGYKGYIYKFRKSNTVKNVYAEAVHDSDEFFISKGSKPEIIHKPNLTSGNYGMDDKITFFYAIIKFHNGEDEFEVMSKQQVDEIKSRAKTQNVWNYNYQEMGRKTVIRRLEKKVQLPELQELIKYESEVDEKIYKTECEVTEPEKIFDKEKQKEINKQLKETLAIMGWDKKKFLDFIKFFLGVKSIDKLTYGQKEKITSHLKQEIDGMQKEENNEKEN